MRRPFALISLWILLVAPGLARRIKVICGTGPEHSKEEMHLHRQSVLARRAARLQSTAAPSAPHRSASRDMGNIVVVDDSDGVVAQRNPFNLDNKTLTFTPASVQAVKYQFRVAGDPFDHSAASKGTTISLSDDDFKEVSLAFTFPFFGNTYTSVFINSDGDLTFGRGENASTDRSLGRIVAGPPRVAALFDDLNPSAVANGVTITSDPSRLIVSWQAVPEFDDLGGGPAQTFQIRLYPDGRVQFAYAGISISSAVVGIAPGNLQGSSSVVSFIAGSSSDYSSTIAERFSSTSELDIQTAAQKIFESHDDDYDYIAFFNDLNMDAGSGALAWEQTVRNRRTGYGEPTFDAGGQYGSASRLQAVLNLGPISQYPVDPEDPVTAGGRAGYNGLRLIAHETGHLFLAYASVRDIGDPFARPLLRGDLAHWNFVFNAEASFMEGNRILDNGPTASPRFKTTAIVDEYSPLDQYLMGLRPATEVPQTYLVTGPSEAFANKYPQLDITFDGARREIPVSEIIAAVGRRTPDFTVSQRHFRMAFVLIAKAGSTPSAATLTQLENYRTRFEAFFHQATGGRAFLDTALRRGLALSISPAAGILLGGTTTATVSVQQSAEAALTVNLQAASHNATVPASVVIPKDATSATFEVAGVRQGVDQITATPADDHFSTAHANIQVLRASALQLLPVSGDKQVINSDGTLSAPVVLQVVDANNLSYQGAQVQAAAAGGGTVTPSLATADSRGQATFQWSPGSTTAQLQVFLQGTGPASGLTISAFEPTTITPSGIVNAASFTPSLSPGAIGTIYGTTLSGGVTQQAGLFWPVSLGGVRVFVNGAPARLLYVSEKQINFLVPSDAQEGNADVTVLTASGTSATAQFPITALSPGIFFDAATNFGAILNAGTTLTTQQQAVARGKFIEIYCTGLGALQINDDGLPVTLNQPQVTIGNVQATVTFSGIAGFYSGGLYQVNAQIPENAAVGTQNLSMTINGIQSNSVKIAVQ